MSSEKLDQALSDIIGKGGRGRGRGRGRGQGRGRGRGRRRSGATDGPGPEIQNPLLRGEDDGGKDDGASSGPVRKRRNTARTTPYDRDDATDQHDWKHDKYDGRGGGLGGRLTAEAKVLVGHLDKDVTEEDLRGIFQQIGPLKDIVINFDRDGRSLGTAEVTFSRTADAQTAVEEYDEAEVDGKPMYLKLVSALAPAPRLIVKKDKDSSGGVENTGRRVTRGRTARANGGTARGRGVRRGRGGGRGGRGGSGGRGGGRGSQGGRGRGRGRGGRGRGGGGGNRDPKKEDLDAEMDAYQTQRSGEGEGKKNPVSGSAGQPTAIPKVKPTSTSENSTTGNGTTEMADQE